MIMFVWWVMEKLDQAYHAGFIPEPLGKKICNALDNYYTSE